ncbi:MAG TPA: hypothetical protein VE219_04005 [Candidatus Sulfotelmatobacter sp.]|nr:hypothetical protein [Candidatus Sulfotelmatobacter sp.]
MDEAESKTGDTVKGVADAPGEAVDELRGGGNPRGEDSEGDRQGPQTMREELGSIVRETAMEVLKPIMVSATRQAAKYAVKKAPEVAIGKLLPKLRELGSNVEEAGGAGAFARETLSSASEGGGLSKLKELGRRNDEDSKGSERVPEQESVDVAVPLDRAYQQFTSLDDFAELLSGGEVVDEEENERIVWTSGDENATAVITFHRLDDRLTRVMVLYDEQPQNFASKAFSALQSRKRALRTDLARFRALAEMSELQSQDEGDGEARSSDEAERPRRRRRSSRAQEPDEDDYDEDEPYEGEVEEEPEAEADDEEEPEAEADDEEIPEAEVEDEGDVEDESEEEPEPEPEQRPVRRRQTTRRRAPARPSRARAKRT